MSLRDSDERNMHLRRKVRQQLAAVPEALKETLPSSRSSPSKHGLPFPLYGGESQGFPRLHRLGWDSNQGQHGCSLCSFNSI